MKFNQKTHLDHRMVSGFTWGLSPQSFWVPWRRSTFPLLDDFLRNFSNIGYVLHFISFYVFLKQEHLN